MGLFFRISMAKFSLYAGIKHSSKNSNYMKKHKHKVYFLLQLIGFIILLIGMACYNNIVVPQLIRKCQSRLGRHKLRESEDHIINTAADDVQETI